MAEGGSYPGALVRVALSSELFVSGESTRFTPCTDVSIFETQQRSLQHR